MKPWPRTVEEAVDCFLRALGPEWKEVVRSKTRERAQGMNLRLGLWIRNEFGLWRGNHELLAACARLDEADAGAASGASVPRVIDPDRASFLILGVAWDRLRESEGEHSGAS